MAAKVGIVSPTDDNYELRGQKIGTRANRSMLNRRLHVSVSSLSLAPCPFCNGPAEMREGPFTYVQCSECKASGPKGEVAGDINASTAARFWNDRKTRKR